MSNLLSSIHSTRTIRIVGLAAAIATLGTACGATTIPSSDASTLAAESAALVDPTPVAQNSPLADDQTSGTAPSVPSAPVESAETQATSEPAPSAEPEAQQEPASETAPEVDTAPESAPASETQPEPESDPAPEEDTQPNPDPASDTEPEPATDPEPPAPNLAPVLDTVRVTRQGVHVTVGINASDPDSDNLALTVVGVLGTDGETFEHAASEDSGVFQMPFDAAARGTVTITTSVTDGTNTTTQADTIDIAPLLHVIHSAGEIVASNGCFIDNDELTYQAGVTSLVLDPRGSLQFLGEVVEPIVLTRQNRGSQLLRSTISSDFEEATGFATIFDLKATIGDISIKYGTSHVEAGRYQTPTFVSPSDPACWVNIGYVISVQPAA